MDIDNHYLPVIKFSDILQLIEDLDPSDSDDGYVPPPPGLTADVERMYLEYLDYPYGGRGFAPIDSYGRCKVCNNALPWMGTCGPCWSTYFEYPDLVFLAVLNCRQAFHWTHALEDLPSTCRSCRGEPPLQPKRFHSIYEPKNPLQPDSLDDVD